MALSGCGSIAKGVTEAILEQETPGDSRLCEVTGRPFHGVRQALLSQEQEASTKTTKVLMVHGISRHLPGYSTLFREKLVTELGLDLISKEHKEISIRHEDFKDEKGNLEELGILRVTRHMNRDKTQEMLFYELTWSHITDPDRAELEFDNSGEYSFKRADINHTIKTFFNNTVADLMAYRGTSKEKINFSVAQANCWTFSGDWNDIPNEGAHICDIGEKDISKDVLEDDYFFVTHSLGSRITVDTIANATHLIQTLDGESENMRRFFDALKQKEITVFMLSNQLPLLQLGRERPEVTGSMANYCLQDAMAYDNRIFRQLNLVAFSDPNDLLSYPIPPRFAENNIDSRLCPEIINVNINVTDVKDLFGLEFANPAEAHNGYYADDRVVAIVSDGLMYNSMNDLVANKCRWIQTTD
jgi:hypothetical protein